MSGTEQLFRKLVQQNEEAMLRCLRAEKGSAVELSPDLKARAAEKALRMWERHIYEGARLKAQADEIRRRARSAEKSDKTEYNWFVVFATFAPGVDVQVCFAAVHTAVTRHLAPRDYRLTFRRAGVGLQARMVADLGRRTTPDVRREVFQLLRGVLHSKDDVRVLTTRTPDAEARAHLDAYLNPDDEAADCAWREVLGMERVYAGGVERRPDRIEDSSVLPMPPRLSLPIARDRSAAPAPPAPEPGRSESPPTPEASA